MEFIKAKKLYMFLLSAIILIAIFALSGCGSSGEFSLSNDADYLFAIRAGYTTTSDEKPLDDLLGLTADEAKIVNYDVEDSNVLNIDNAGIISAENTTNQDVTYVTATYGNITKKIKVVVAGDYNPDIYNTYDNLYIPYGTSTIGPGYEGASCRFLYIPSTVTEIAEGAFKECKNLTDVSLPSNMTEITNSIFYNCSSLKYITIPDGVTTIGESSFRGCSSLENISIPDSVSKINGLAFYACKSLQSISLTNSLTYLGEKAFCGCESLSSVYIPDGITTINDDTFSACSSISDLVLPETLTAIGDRAFQGCKSIETLVLPNSLTSLGTDAFSGCINIKSMTIPITLPIENSSFPSVASVTYFKLTGKGAGYNYNSTNCINTPWYISRNHRIKVDIEEGVTAIGDYTFVYCYGLTEINLPNSLTSINHGAFRKCFNLESVVIPDSVTQIGIHAFSLDYALKNITYSNNLCSIGNYAFYCCTSITDVTLPDTVSYIGEGAYSGCNNIETINLGSSSKSNLKIIGKRAFAGFLFKCKEVNIYSTKLKYVIDGAFGYIGDEEPTYTIATLSRDSVIKVANSKMKKLFVADENYNGQDTTVEVR